MKLTRQGIRDLNDKMKNERKINDKITCIHEWTSHLECQCQGIYYDEPHYEIYKKCGKVRKW